MALKDCLEQAGYTPTEVDALIRRIDADRGEVSQEEAFKALIPDLENELRTEMGTIKSQLGIKEEPLTGQQNTEFFTEKAREASSDVPYEPVLDISNVPEKVKNSYEEFTAGGNFTGHISKMIPGFAEKQTAVAHAISSIPGVSNFLDIGASEGGLVKTVSDVNSNIRSVAVDPNPQMQQNFNQTREVPNTEYNLAALGASWVDSDGNIIREFETDEKFDVINEDFTFQFISNDRENQISQVKELLKDDGLFITSEKFHTKNAEANEARKLEHQRKYFTEDQLTEDEEGIITGMADTMVRDKDYVKLLNNEFSHVREFWNAGNFKGYVASNDISKINQFTESVGDLSSEFSDAESFTSEGGLDINTTSPKEFSDAMAKALSKRKKDASQVDLVTEEEAQKIVDDGGILLLSENNEFGGYVKADGYMGGLFKDPDSSERQVARQLQDVRITLGGTHFDAYGVNSRTGEGTILESLYIKNGFVPIARIKFNEEFAPENFQDTTLASKPDVVFFAYNPDAAKGSTPGDGVFIDDYQQGIDLAREAGEAGQTSINLAEDTTIEEEIDDTTPPAEVVTSTLDQDLAAVEADLQTMGNELVVAVNNAVRDAGLDARQLQAVDNSPFVQRIDELGGKLVKTKQAAKAIEAVMDNPFRIPASIKPAIEENIEGGLKGFRKRAKELIAKKKELQARTVKRLQGPNSSLPLNVKVGDKTFGLVDKDGVIVYEGPNKSESASILRSMIPAILVRTKRTQGVSPRELSRQVTNVKKALKKVRPDLDIQVLPNDEYARRTGQPRGNTTKGNLLGDTLLINRDKATVTTVPHEAAHAALLGFVGVNDTTVTTVHQALRKVLNRKNAPAREKALAKELDQFITNYVNDKQVTDRKAHEFFAELVGFLSANREQLSKPSLTKRIVNAINDVIEKLIGIRPLTQGAEISEIIDFVNTLSNNLAEGVTVTTDIAPSIFKDPGISNDLSNVEFNQATDVFKGILDKLGIPVGVGRNGRPTNRKVVEALHKYYKDNFKSFESTDFSNEARDKYIEYGFDEVMFALSEWGNKSGVGWYTTDFQESLDILAQVYPTLTDPTVRKAATLITAITSAAEAVLQNFRALPGLIESYNETGRFNSELANRPNIKANLDKVNILLDNFNGDVNAVNAWLVEEVPVSQSTREAKDLGVYASPGWEGGIRNENDLTLPRSVSVFGPKIGAFYANLAGVHGLPTMDRWFLRTAFRYNGDARTYARQKDIDAFRKKHRMGKVSNEHVLSVAYEHHLLFNKALKNKKGLSKEKRNKLTSKYRKGAEIWKVNSGIVESIEKELTAENQRKFRTFWKNVVEGIQDKLAVEDGLDLSVSDIQAVLWLLEKRLYGHLGVQQKPKDTYSEAAKQIVNETPTNNLIATNETPSGEYHFTTINEIETGLENPALDQRVDDATGFDNIIREMHAALPNLTIEEKVKILQEGGIDITVDIFKDIVSPFKDVKPRPVPKETFKPGDLMPQQLNQETLKELRQLLNVQEIDPGKETTLAWIKDSYENWISKDGYYGVEMSLAIDAIEGVALDPAQQIALAYAVARLKGTLVENRKAVALAKSQGANRHNIRSLQDAVDSTEEVLDFFTRAGMRAGSTAGRALAVRAQIFDFARYSNENMRVRMNEEYAKFGKKLTTQDGKAIQSLAGKIESVQAQIDKLSISRNTKAGEFKNNVAESELATIKKKKKRGKKKSLADSLSALDKVLKGDIC